MHALLRHRPFPRHGEQVAVAAGLQFLSLNGWRADLGASARRCRRRGGAGLRAAQPGQCGGGLAVAASRGQHKTDHPGADLHCPLSAAGGRRLGDFASMDPSQRGSGHLRTKPAAIPSGAMQPPAETAVSDLPASPAVRAGWLLGTGHGRRATPVCCSASARPGADFSSRARLVGSHGWPDGSEAGAGPANRPRPV